MAETGQCDKAFSYFSEALRINPEYADAKSNIEIISAKIAKESQE